MIFVVAFVVMLSVLIFVHELGHFAVAKLCGVRVLKFSLGFGNPIGFGRWRMIWRRGHTDYVVAWIPLGGFVKMLGENPDELDDDQVRAHPSETLGAKPLWQKLAIVFAGPAMNLILPVFVFAGTLAVGIDRRDAVIGTVEQSSPAAEAGLLAGDRITALDGEPAHWWEDVEDAIRGNPGAALRVAYERDGRSGEVGLRIGSRNALDEFGQPSEFGWVGLDQHRTRALIGIPSDDSPASRAGLHSGDLVIAVGGQTVGDWAEFERAYLDRAPGSVSVSVKRGEAQAELDLELPALGSLAELGAIPAMVLISGVSPDSPAARARLEPGDLILELDGGPVRSFQAFAEAVRTSGGRSLELALVRDGAVVRVDIAPELVDTEVGFGIEEPRYLVGITGEQTTLVGAVALDRVRNPLIALPRAVGMTVDVTHTFLRGLGKLVTGEVSRKQLAGPIGIATIAGEALQRGWETYLAVMVLISINLGILNLLPIPVLDGGQAVIFTLEGIKRSPLSLRSRIIFQQIGIYLLIFLMGLAFWNDVSRHWSTVVEWLRSGTGS
jgi:regulator of sigma E protease